MVLGNRLRRLLRSVSGYRGDNSGQVIALTKIALVVLLAMAGLAADIGMLMTQRRDMQTAADAAAIGFLRRGLVALGRHAQV